MLCELNHRPLRIKVTSRYLDFKKFGTYKGGYFSSNANDAAFEHRFVMQASGKSILQN